MSEVRKSSPFSKCLGNSTQPLFGVLLCLTQLLSLFFVLFPIPIGAFDTTPHLAALKQQRESRSDEMFMYNLNLGLTLQVLGGTSSPLPPSCFIPLSVSTIHYLHPFSVTPHPQPKEKFVIKAPLFIRGCSHVVMHSNSTSSPVFF